MGTFPFSHWTAPCVEIGTDGGRFERVEAVAVFSNRHFTQPPIGCSFDGVLLFFCVETHEGPRCFHQLQHVHQLLENAHRQRPNSQQPDGSGCCASQCRPLVQVKRYEEGFVARTAHKQKQLPRHAKLKTRRKGAYLRSVVQADELWGVRRHRFVAAGAAADCRVHQHEMARKVQRNQRLEERRHAIGVNSRQKHHQSRGCHAVNVGRGGEKGMAAPSRFIEQTHTKANGLTFKRTDR